MQYLLVQSGGRGHRARVSQFTDFTQLRYHVGRAGNITGPWWLIINGESGQSPRYRQGETADELLDLLRITKAAGRWELGYPV